MIRFTSPVLVVVILIFTASASIAQMGAIAAVDEPAERAAAKEGSGGVAGGNASARSPQTGTTGKKKRTASRTKSAAKPSSTTAAARQRKAAAKYDGFVLGDKYTFLNFEVISGDKPYYTRVAKAAGATGLVQVEVLIDEDGTVLSSKARTGNKLLWPEAERAALSSRFNKPAIYGKPARAIGFLVYSFGTVNEKDEY